MSWQICSGCSVIPPGSRFCTPSTTRILFRVFGDSTRIKILYALHDQELCVQDIAGAVALSQSAVSHQLRVLKDSKLVRFRREGKTVYYALDDDHVRSILSLGMEHIEE